MHACTQGTPNTQTTVHLSVCSFICSLGLSSSESDSTVRWLDLEAGLHEVDGEPLREERLVIEYQVSIIMFQVSSTFGEWGGWQEVDKEMSVTSSAVSTTDLVCVSKVQKAFSHLNPHHMLMLIVTQPTW